MKITKKKLFWRITAITLAVILMLTGLLLFALMVNSMLLGVVHDISGESVLVLVAQPSAFWFLSGDSTDAIILRCGKQAASLSPGDVVLAHPIGGTVDMYPPRMSAKFIWRLPWLEVDA